MTTTYGKGWNKLQQNSKQDKAEFKTGMCTIITPDRRQSKMLLKIDERGSKIARNSVFDCHLSPMGNGNRKLCF